MEDNIVISNMNSIPSDNSPGALVDRGNPIIEITNCELDTKMTLNDDTAASNSDGIRSNYRLESDKSTVIQNDKTIVERFDSRETTVEPHSSHNSHNSHNSNNSEVDRLDVHQVECSVPTALLKKFSRHKSQKSQYPPFLSRDKARPLCRSHSLPDLSSQNVDFSGNYRCGCNYHLKRRCIGLQVSYKSAGSSQQISDVENMSADSKSTSSSQAPPHYRSLISSILQDEPPKYQDVTGKALSRELLQTPRSSTTRSIYRSPTFMNCVTGFASFFGIIIVISLILYIIDLHFHMFKTLKGAHHRRGRLVSPPFSDKGDKM